MAGRKHNWRKHLKTDKRSGADKVACGLGMTEASLRRQSNSKSIQARRRRRQQMLEAD